MDKRQTLKFDEALNLVRRYKQVISSRFQTEPRVMMYGSYSKGYANPDSDIDVAVIVPKFKGTWLDNSTLITMDAFKLSTLIEPVLMQENEPSPLYRDVMRTGIAV